MKILLLATLLVTSAAAERLNPEKIIPRFYELLMQKEKPLQQDEIDFFGGDECEYIAKTIIKKDGFTKSRTPIWDFVRANRTLFITEGVTDLAVARIHYSTPFLTTRLWNGTSPDVMKIQVVFSTKKTGNTSYSGMSTAVFSLGKGCYIDLGATYISQDVVQFLEKVYEK